MGRYLAAMLYDSLLILAVLFIASLVYMIPYMTSGSIDATQSQNLSNTTFQTPMYKTYIFVIWFLFLTWFWTHGGQTLGLRVWKLRVQTADAKAISLVQALLRFLASLAPWVAALFLYYINNKAGLLPSPYNYCLLLFGFSGIAWKIFDPDNLTAHDRFSETRVVRISSPT